MRILVIDDYRSHGESLVELLLSWGHEALYAAGYDDAQWLLDLFKFDVALLDCDMPGMNGPAVAEKLAERFPDLRSVIVSARPPGTSRAELGSLHFISKPVRPQELLDFLQLMIRERAGCSIVLRSVYSLVKYR
jgi:DNA-binding response OmpR family regulator